MSQYRIGSVDVTNGSPIVVGIGTSWLTEVTPGDIFIVDGDNASFFINSVDTDLQITLNVNFTGTAQSGAGYTITRDFTTSLSLPLLFSNDINTAVLWREAMNIIDNAGLGTFSTIDVDDINEKTFDNGIIIDINTLVKDGALTNAYLLSEEYVLNFYNGVTNPEIVGLTGGTNFGGLWEGSVGGHIVMALRDNDADDSFSVISGGGNYTGDTTWDTLAFRVKANGVSFIGGDLTVDANLLALGNNTDATVIQRYNADRATGSAKIGQQQYSWNGTIVARISGVSGADTINKDDGYLTFSTAEGGVLSERVRIAQSGFVGIGKMLPASLLHLAAASPEFRIEDTSDSSYASMIYGASTLTISADAGNSAASSSLVLAVDGTAGLTIDDSFLVTVASDIVLTSGGPRIIEGTGDPEGIVTAPVGSTFHRSDGGADTTLYIKESGAGNSGWVAAGAGGGGTTGVDVEDEGSPVLSAAMTLDFAGAGVTATDAGGNTATITIPGGISGVDIEDEGSLVVSDITTFNFTGTGISATDAGGGEITVNVPGGGVPDPLQLSAGSVIAPTYSFSANTTDGIYNPALGIVGFVADGTEIARVISTGIDMISGGVLNMRGGAINLSAGGPQILTGSGAPEGSVTAVVGTIYQRNDGASSNTLYVKESGTGNIGWVAVETGGGVSDPLLLGDGSAGAPTFSYSSTPDAGHYLSGTDTVATAAGGVGRLFVSPTAVTSTLPIQGINGSDGVPTYGNSNDNDTGMYFPGDDLLGFTIGGSPAWFINDDLDLFATGGGKIIVSEHEMGSGGPTQTTGTGSPEGVVTAPVGSTFHRSDGGAGTTYYIKESGAGNTGWAAVAPITVPLTAVTVVTAAGPYNVAALDEVIIINQTVAAAITVNLPAIGTTGRVIEIKDGKGDASTNNITLDGDASETIDGDLTFVLNSDHWALRLIDNGTEWSIL